VFSAVYIPYCSGVIQVLASWLGITGVMWKHFVPVLSDCLLTVGNTHPNSFTALFSVHIGNSVTPGNRCQNHLTGVM